ncbi:MAG: YggS family pyridoxal phosphate-dependent enzyme [Thermodesulfovibrio sp.]|nr:YggS family pyridoxal phosphate-dependent enzyme [Thermodesulfovibrio sp.]
MADTDLFSAIKSIHTRMARAALKAERDLSEVRLLAVTKEVTAEAVSEAIDNGLREFGESRVQIAREKIPRVRAMAGSAVVNWHMIGPLQKNKVKTAVELFDLIHSVDSPELAALINEHAAGMNTIQRVLIEVKLSPEESKHGVDRGGVIALLEATRHMRNLQVDGLMTVPPFMEDPEKTRPYFQELKALRDEIETAGFSLKDLSMGMSHDFEIAIEEGATLVRVGTALFGERKKEEA